MYKQDILLCNSTLDSRRLLHTPKPRPHGFDFSCQGLLGIWDGFSVSGRRSNETVPPSSPVSGLKSLLMEHVSLELGQPPGGHSGRSRSRHGSSRRTSHLFVDTAAATATPLDDFSQALLALSARNGDDGNEADPWRPGTPTAKLVQRRFGLQLCGWSLREEELNNAIALSATCTVASVFTI